VRCTEGKYKLCPEMAFAACPAKKSTGESGLATHGCLTKYFNIPADFCYKLPDGGACEDGVLVEPLVVAVHAVRMVYVQPGDDVVSFGAVGLLTAVAARTYGASKVVAVIF
jgi:D-xylulose reductase